jgi:3-methyladenine DNA glycosylase Tag
VPESYGLGTRVRLNNARVLFTFMGKRSPKPPTEALSKDLVKRGFRFVGPKICYAFMQSVGLVNDHIIGCFRRDLNERSGTN